MSAIRGENRTLDHAGEHSTRVNVRNAVFSVPLGRASLPTPAPSFPGALSAPLRLGTLRRISAACEDLPDPTLERLVRLTSDVLRMPVVVLSLVSEQRQEVVSGVGLPAPYATDRVIPPTHSICRYTVAGEAPLVIKDARRHPWVRANRAVHELGVVSYAGIPLVVEGQTVGSLCAIGYTPHTWTQEELHTLHGVATLASEILTRRAQHVAVNTLHTLQRDIIETLVTSSLPHQDMIHRVLGCIGERLSWDIVNLWTPDDERTSLCMADIWSGPRMNTRVFEERLRSVQLRTNESMAGAAYVARAAIWSADLAEIGSSTRRLFTPIVGVQSGFACPIAADDEVIGVVCCFSQEHRAEDAALIKFSPTLGRYLAEVYLRERASRALAEAKARERSLVDMAPVAVVMMGADGIVSEWSAGAERLFGYSREQAIGRKMHHLIVPPHLRAAHMAGLRRHVETGEEHILGKRVTVSAQRADGTRIPVELTISRVPQDGAPVFIGYLRRAESPDQAETSRDVQAPASQWPSLT